MTDDDLAAALHACAAGLYPLEAGVALLAGSRAFLHRPDFAGKFIEHGTSGGNRDGRDRLGRRGRRPQQGELLCSGGERRIFLLPASLAGGIPVDPPATPSASTTATSGGCSPRSATHPGNGLRPADIDDRF
jgi:hypothetical protein